MQVIGDWSCVPPIVHFNTLTGAAYISYMGLVCLPVQSPPPKGIILMIEQHFLTLHVTHMLVTCTVHAPAFTCALTHTHTFIACALFACHACK